MWTATLLNIFQWCDLLVLFFPCWPLFGVCRVEVEVKERWPSMPRWLLSVRWILGCCQISHPAILDWRIYHLKGCSNNEIPSGLKTEKWMWLMRHNTLKMYEHQASRLRDFFLEFNYFTKGRGIYKRTITNDAIIWICHFFLCLFLSFLIM